MSPRSDPSSEFVAPAEVSIRQYRALIDGVVKRLGDDLAIGREDRDNLRECA